MALLSMSRVRHLSFHIFPKLLITMQAEEETSLYFEDFLRGLCTLYNTLYSQIRETSEGAKERRDPSSRTIRHALNVELW